MTGRLATLATLAVLGALAVGPSAHAAPEPLDVVGVDATRAPEMGIVVAAPPALAGVDLPPESWSLREDGERRTIRVTPVSNEGLEIVLALDTSGSMEGEPLAAAKAAAVGFLDGMPAGSRGALVSFDDDVAVEAAMTDDRAALAQAVRALGAHGETALYDGVATAASLFTGGADTRRALVVLSDGGDTASTVGAAAALEAVSGVDASGYVVSLVTPETDTAALQRLADEAGGKVVAARDPAAITDVLSGIATSLTNQYLLTFDAEGRKQSVVAISLRRGDVEAATERVVEVPTGTATTATARAPAVLVPDADESWKLVAGLSAAALGLLALGLFVVFGRRAGERRQRRLPNVRLRPPRPSALEGVSARAATFAQQSLDRSGRGARLNAALEQAGLEIRPGEYVVLASCVSLFGFAVGLLATGLIGALVLAALVAVGFRLALGFLARRRKARFADQLVDTLQLLSGSLRAGYGMLQAVDAVAREADSPTAEEFQRLVIETRLGRSVSDALHALAERVGNEDFEWVVQAVDINREVGGDLTEVLDRVAETIRERDQIRRQVKALSAEGRISAVILVGLPIGMVLFIRAVNPEYLGELTGSPVGVLMILIGAVLLVLGGIWLRKIVQVRF